jgi:hypothetical protein
MLLELLCLLEFHHRFFQTIQFVFLLELLPDLIHRNVLLLPEETPLRTYIVRMIDVEFLLSLFMFLFSLPLLLEQYLVKLFKILHIHLLQFFSFQLLRHAQCFIFIKEFLVDLPLLKFDLSLLGLFFFHDLRIELRDLLALLTPLGLSDLSESPILLEFLFFEISFLRELSFLLHISKPILFIFGLLDSNSVLFLNFLIFHLLFFKPCVRVNLFK